LILTIDGGEMIPILVLRWRYIRSINSILPLL